MAKTLEQRIEELEKRVAALEGQVPEQPMGKSLDEIVKEQLNQKNEYAISFDKPKLLKPKLTRRLLNYFK